MNVRSGLRRCWGVFLIRAELFFFFLPNMLGSAGTLQKLSCGSHLRRHVDQFVHFQFFSLISF